MKKLIAVAVVLVLVTGAAFADTSLGGNLGVKVDTIKGDNQKNPDGTATKPKGGLDFTAARVDANFSSEKYGGKVRLYSFPMKGWWQGFSTTNPKATTTTTDTGIKVLDGDGKQVKDADGKPLFYDGVGPYSTGTTGAPFAFVWWKPVDLFRLQVGHNPDGNFGAQQIGGWGMNGSAQDFVAIDNDSGDIDNGIAPWRTARSAGYYGGFSDVGVLMSIYPASIVDINLVLPYNSNGHSAGSRAVANIFMDFDVNVVFKLEGVGRVYVSFDSKNSTNDAGFSTGSPGTLWASFFYNGSESLALDFGFGYYLPWSDKGKDGKNKEVVSRSDGFSVGIGARYTSGDFGLRARVGSTLGKVNSGGENTTFGVGLLPSYNFGSFRGFFNTGFGVDFPHEFIGKRTVGYYVNPYVQVPAGGLTFWAGVKLAGAFSTYSVDGLESKTTVNWAVPIGVSVGF